MASQTMYYVYVLRNQDDQSLYKGYSEHVTERLQAHQAKQVFTTAKKDGNYDLIWYAGFETKALALKFERYIKEGSGVAFTNKHLIERIRS